MNIEFQTIEIENFKAFGKRQTVELTGGEAGLRFLRGNNLANPKLSPNGCGKSSVWDALTWCLYGRTVDNLRNPDIRPWSGKGTTDVMLSISVDGSQFNITRTASPNQLTINDSLSSQEAVDALVGINYKTFTQTILFGQDKTLFFDLEPREQMRLFADVLQLDRWEARSQAATDRIRDELEPVQRQIEGDLASIEGQLVQLEATYTTLEASAEQWETERQERVTTESGSAEKLKKQLEHAISQQNSADLAYDSACTEAKALDSTIEKYADALTKYSKQEATIKSLEREYETLTLAVAKDNKCPTCGQIMKNDKHVKLRFEELDKAMRAIKYDPKMRQKTEQLLSTARTDAKEFTHKAETAEAELSMHRRAVSDLQSKLKALESTINLRTEQDNPYTFQVHKLRKQRVGLKAQQVERQKEAHVIERKTARTKFWVKGFRDIQLYVTEEVLQELQLVSNTMLVDVGMDDWEIQYAIEKENKSGNIQSGLTITILSPHNDKPVRWESWSGGEKQRLKLIGAIALSEVLLSHAGVQANIQVFDEPMKYLSLEGARDICTMLEDNAQRLGKFYWLVDHLATPSLQAPSVTVVRGADGVARIESSI